jgi:hypothetical protein
MIGAQRIGFDPALPASWLIALGLIAIAAWGIYLWRGGGAPILRAAGLAFVLLGLAQPQWVREVRQAADDVALLLVDQSESLALAGRLGAAQRAGERIAALLADQPGLEVRVREARGGPDGTAIAAPIEDALADVARGRIAGVIVVTDGQAADAPAEPRDLAPFGPIHTLIVGDPERGDRRLELISAPTFGIVGEPMRISARVVDPSTNAQVLVRVTIDGAPAAQVRVRANRPFNVDVRTPKRGRNMVIVEAEAGRAEISTANNRAAFVANGVRDRLRVLLVTGEPYPGERVWRNLLKSDPAVDLVHFTILRPPVLQFDDYTPTNELALIEFPRQELFEQRLGEFDLIIFDRFRRYAGYQSILEPYYFSNIAKRVEEGGALLITAGEAESGADGVFRTALAAILPSQPTGRVIDEAYRPAPTQLGLRHPVVRGLPRPQAWGRWTRLIEARASGGRTVLQAEGGRPLLVLDHAGEGRVAQLWSDQAWLWARGYDGGGPHGELLRRLAHWLMREPELEDERVSLTPGPQGLTVERDTLASTPGEVEIIGPNGARQTPQLRETEPGLWRGQAEAKEQGLYEARAGNLRAFASVGPLNPREAAALNADPEILRPLAEASGGSVTLTGETGEDLPEIRRVGRGVRASGEGWIGLERNGAYVVRAAAAAPLGPGWAWALAGVALLMWGWRREAK